MNDRHWASVVGYLVIALAAVWFVFRFPSGPNSPLAARLVIAATFVIGYAVFDRVLPTLLADRARWIPYLMLAVLAWGMLLALGTWLFGGNEPLMRALIVLATTVAFLSMWLLALASRQRRLRQGEKR